MLSLKNSAQPTITSSDLPVPYEIWVNYSDNAPTFPTPVPGTGQIWDFTTLNPTDTGGVYFEPNWAIPFGWAGVFPGSNMAFQNTEDTSAVFIKTQPGGMFFDGVIRFQDSLLPSGANFADYSPDRPFLLTPISYNDSLAQPSRILIDYNIDLGGTIFPVRATIDFVSVFVAEGSGTAITPLGTYSDILMVRNYTFQYDSVFVDFGGGYVLQNSDGPKDTTMAYMFLKNGPRMLIAEAYYDFISASVPNAAWYETYTVTDLREPLAGSLTIGPNPLIKGENIRVSGEAGSDLLIFSSEGKFIRKVQLNESVQEIQTSDLSSGTYNLFSARAGKIKKRQQLVVTR